MNQIRAVLLLAGLAAAPAVAQVWHGPPIPQDCRSLLLEQRVQYMKRYPLNGASFFKLRAGGAAQALAAPESCRECAAVAKRLSAWIGSPAASIPGAECIIGFLGSGYYLTGADRQCGADGFPYTIVPLN